MKKNPCTFNLPKITQKEARKKSMVIESVIIFLIFERINYTSSIHRKICNKKENFKFNIASIY